MILDILTKCKDITVENPGKLKCLDKYVELAEMVSIRANLIWFQIDLIFF